MGLARMRGTYYVGTESVLATPDDGMLRLDLSTAIRIAHPVISRPGLVRRFHRGLR